MIARGSEVYTRRGYVLVEDLEGEDFPVPHPTRGFAFVRAADPVPVFQNRVVLMLRDGRDIIVAAELGVFLEGGALVPADRLQPGSCLAGPVPGVLEGISRDEGTLLDISTLHGVPFVVNGLSVMG